MLIMLSDLSDVEIVTKCQLDQTAAFKELVKRKQKFVEALLRQLAPELSDTKDLAQEVFLKVYRSIRSLKNPRAFKSWLNEIVLSVFYDYLRSKPAEVVYLEDFYDKNHQFTSNIGTKPAELLENTELNGQIKLALKLLPEQYRTVLVLRELQGLSYDEIAGLLSCALGTVKSRLSRAREKLQLILTPYLESRDTDNISELKVI
jgi:RNA polymerase sigma-70 factor (ECF subfamily)